VYKKKGPWEEKNGLRPELKKGLSPSDAKKQKENGGPIVLGLIFTSPKGDLQLLSMRNPRN